MLIALLVVTGAVAAYLWPAPFLGLGGGLKPAFALTMLLVGTLVEREQLLAFRRAPTRPLVGLMAQYTIMPLGAAALSRIFSDPATRTGVLLVGCMPGAMASNVMTVLFRGDLVLSVSMTTIATLFCPVLLLTWLPLLGGAGMTVDTVAMAGDALWMVVAPVAVGILARWAYPGLDSRWARVATAVASVTIVLIVLVVVAANSGTLAHLTPGLVLAMVALNVGGYGFAYGAGRVLRFPPAQRRTLVLEVGMQNAGLGVVLALGHLGPTGAVPSAFYTVLCIVTAALALPLAKRLGLHDTAPSAPLRRRADIAQAAADTWRTLPETRRRDNPRQKQ